MAFLLWLARRHEPHEVRKGKDHTATAAFTGLGACAFKRRGVPSTVRSFVVSSPSLPSSPPYPQLPCRHHPAGAAPPSYRCSPLSANSPRVTPLTPKRFQRSPSSTFSRTRRSYNRDTLVPTQASRGKQRVAFHPSRHLGTNGELRTRPEMLA